MLLSLAVHERRAVLLPDYAQELVEGVEGINRHPHLPDRSLISILLLSSKSPRSTPMIKPLHPSP